MKKFFLFATIAFATLAVSCKSDNGDEPDVPTRPTSAQIVSGDITENTTWTADKQWLMDGVVKVKNGATLTIEPGTIVKGKIGSKATLVILRGAKINAVGTASKPIVMTSDQPAGSRSAGDWGGVILCGKAPHNLYNPANPDGLKPEGGIIDAEITFGGEDANDNSGTMQYVRIEFAGYVFAEGNEINGFTLCSVGKGTKIDHIQVSYPNDDAYEWFGGTVDAKYIISYGCLDDDFDTDNGFSGNVQYGLILRDKDAHDISNSNGFESDNNSSANAALPQTSAVFSNITALGPLATSAELPASHKHQFGFQIRRNSSISIFNSVFAGFQKGGIFDTEKKPNGEEGSIGNAKAGKSVVNNVVFAAIGTAQSEWFEKSATKETDVPYFATYMADTKNKISNKSTLAEIGLNIGSLTNPNFLPTAGSMLLNSGLFTHTKLAGFESTANFVGAFSSSDWTQGWANFDPQNADYELAK